MTDAQTAAAIFASNPTPQEIRGALMLIAGSHTQKAQDEYEIWQFYQERKAS